MHWNRNMRTASKWNINSISLHINFFSCAALGLRNFYKARPYKGSVEAGHLERKKKKTHPKKPRGKTTNHMG